MPVIVLRMMRQDCFKVKDNLGYKGVSVSKSYFNLVDNSGLFKVLVALLSFMVGHDFFS